MRSSTKLAIIAALAASSLNPLLAQSGQPGLYAFHTQPAKGGCPGLDWHVTVEPNNSLVGFVAWDQGKHVARLEGSIKTDRTFEMAAEEVGGASRKATVKGTAGGNNINISINGSGTPCDNIILSIPRVAGGLGGGGG